MHLLCPGSGQRGLQLHLRTGRLRIKRVKQPRRRQAALSHAVRKELDQPPALHAACHVGGQGCRCGAPHAQAAVGHAQAGLPQGQVIQPPQAPLERAAQQSVVALQGVLANGGTRGSQEVHDFADVGALPQQDHLTRGVFDERQSLM